MAEPGSSAPRSILQHRFVRIPLKLAVGIAVLGAAAFGALVVYNTFDEDLSADAKAMLAPPAMGRIEDGNGFVAFLGMVAPKDQDQMDWGRKAAAAYAAQAQPGFVESPQWTEATRSHMHASDPKKVRKPWCLPEARDCLAEAKRDGAAVAQLLADAENAVLLARYRKAREAPTFADLYLGSSPAARIPGYSSLNAGALLALAETALKFQAGDLEAAVAELEREVAFHRKIIAGGRSVISVMFGNRLLSRDLMTISEMVRSGGERLAPFRARLSALTRPQSSATALDAALRYESHTWVSLGHRIRNILRDNGGWMLSDDLSNSMSPLHNWARSFLAQPNQTANLVAAQAKIDMSITGVSPAQFDARMKEIQAAKAALVAWPWYAKLRNPMGKELFAGMVDLGPYAARMNDLQVLERMIDLQIALATRGITDPAAMAAYIAGEGAQAHADPYSGKAFSFDPAKRLLSFEPRAKGSWGGDLKKRYGKTGIAL